MGPFPYLATRVPSWFAGHMASSLRTLPPLLANIDLVIEVRDARVPLTSVNPAFERVLGAAWGGGGSAAAWEGRRKAREYEGREKVVVYTKRDLAEARFEEPLKEAFLEHAGTKVFFADTRVDQDVRSVLRHAVRSAEERSVPVSAEGMKVLVVGMPNVGKSSLLNALRRVGVHKGKAFATSSVPGLTRKLTGTVKIHESPAIYVSDTPGVMVPHLGKGMEGTIRGLKLAMIAGIKEGLFDEELVAEYLLWTMNTRLEQEDSQPDLNGLQRHTPYPELLSLPPGTLPTDSLETLLSLLAERLGMKRKGAELDIDTARRWFVHAFREGKLGRWTVDADELEAVPEVGTISQDDDGDAPAPQPPTTGDQSNVVAAQDHSTASASTERESESSLKARVSANVRKFIEDQARAEAAHSTSREESTRPPPRSKSKAYPACGPRRAGNPKRRPKG